MPNAEPDTDALLNSIRRGDQSARQRLLGRHRDRLRRMVRVRMDRRLSARIDPSDVVQDVLVEADQGLTKFLQQPPVPFYAWLRRLAWERLVDLHRQHIRATKRSVTREQAGDLALPDESAIALAERLFDRGSNPSGRMLRQELHSRVRHAIDALADRDREVLVLRYLEQLTTDQTAGVLGITTTAVKARHARALTRLHKVIQRDEGGES